MTLSFLYSAVLVCSVVQCSVCKVVLPRVYVRLSWTFFQASSIAPIFTMANFAKMLSKNHKTISTRIETLNRLTVMCILVRIKLRIVQKQLIPHIKAKVIFIFILKNPISKNQKPKQNIILELCHFSIFFCKNFRNCSLVE